MQIGTTGGDLASGPRIRFVARALGQPEINILDGVVDDGRDPARWTARSSVPVPSNVDVTAGESGCGCDCGSDIHVTATRRRTERLMPAR